MTQGRQDGFVGHFSHGGVGVDGACDIFEQRTHFEGECPFAYQLTDMSSNALNA